MTIILYNWRILPVSFIDVAVYDCREVLGGKAVILLGMLGGEPVVLLLAARAYYAL